MGFNLESKYVFISVEFPQFYLCLVEKGSLITRDYHVEVTEAASLQPVTLERGLLTLGRGGVSLLSGL